jgi:hypothetical protein
MKVVSHLRIRIGTQAHDSLRFLHRRDCEIHAAQPLHARSRFSLLAGLRNGLAMGRSFVPGTLLKKTVRMRLYSP